MHTQSQAKTPEQIVEAIFTLDLEPIKFKLMDKEEGHGWSRAEADRHELEYKRFLALWVKFPNHSVAPSKEADKFWHGHILDTMKYAEDCNKVFGYFVHHFPYLGMRGDEDAANLQKAFGNMQRLYEQEFGASTLNEINNDASYCGAAAPFHSKEVTYAAYCGASKAAYCGAAKQLETDEAKHAAYCGASKAAYCGAAKQLETEEAKHAAYCGASKAAYCGAAKQLETEEAKHAAYCGASKAAYCGAAAKNIFQDLTSATTYCWASKIMYAKEASYWEAVPSLSIFMHPC